MFAQRQLSDEQAQIRRAFIDFFEAEHLEEKYTQRMHSMMADGRSRLILDMNDLLEFVPPADNNGKPLGLEIIRDPTTYLPLCELAIHDKITHHRPEYLKVDYRSKSVHVGFEGTIGKVLGPRELYARHLNTLVTLEGVVVRQSPLRPRMLETVHYCPETNKFSRKEYRDQLSPMIDSTHLPTVNVLPKTDMEGHALRTELGLSSFLDSQCAVLQEAPERAPTGQLPRSVELRFDDDLVDCVKPGDRVLLCGVFASYTAADSKNFQSIVMVNNIITQGTTSHIPRLMESHIAEMRRFADRFRSIGDSGILDELSRSIAPAVFGMTNEKKAILLMLIGGIERKAHNSHIRGDINILMVGEPSTAKSQLLRYVNGIAPLALNTTGKGSSGVGLTAAVTVDSYSGERSLSAGAMVLADRGILCIDEFDKMSPQDRVSMHEAMEQQTVTIAKAGIHASLNARCSVLAAANPVYGFYSTKHKLAFNVGLPESLLSRFDLTFIILDQHSSDHNRRIGTHILRNHMRADPVPFDTIVNKTTMEKETNQQKETAKNAAPTVDSSGHPIVSNEFLRHYIDYSRTFSPMLTEASQLMISQHYVQLRSEQGEGNGASKDGFFVTARTLESIIRLATAHARLRFSNTIDENDVAVAMRLLRASVHAASDAASTRRKDKENLVREANRENDTSDERPGKNSRREGQATAAAPAPTTDAAGASVDARQRELIEKVVATFVAEGAESAPLHEFRARILSSSGVDVELPELQRSLSAMAATSDNYVFEEGDDADVLHFTQ